MKMTVYDEAEAKIEQRATQDMHARLNRLHQLLAAKRREFAELEENFKEFQASVAAVREEVAYEIADAQAQIAELKTDLNEATMRATLP